MLVGTDNPELSWDLQDRTIKGLSYYMVFTP